MNEEKKVKLVKSGVQYYLVYLNGEEIGVVHKGSMGWRSSGCDRYENYRSRDLALEKLIERHNSK